MTSDVEKRCGFDVGFQFNLGRTAMDDGSNFDVDNFLDDVSPEDLHDDGKADHLLTHRMRKQKHDVFTIDAINGDEQTDRQCHQHRAAQPPFTRQGLHHAQDLEPFTNDIANLVDDFSQVTTRLALNRNSRHKELQVEIRHAFHHALQSRLNRNAQILLFVGPHELNRDGSGHFFGHHVQTRVQAVTRSQCTGDQAQGVGNLFSELGKPTLPAKDQPYQWQ